MPSTTVFESLFPLLALQSCISAGRGSCNGPRFSALDRATNERFEVRVVICQPESSTTEACRLRAETLLAARSSNRAVILPEDVYVADGGAHAPLRGGHQMVCVSRRCGASLADLVEPQRGASTNVAAPNRTDSQPTMLSEASFLMLLDAVNKFVSIHLTLPVHGNIGPNALVLRSPELADSSCEWAVADWALDPAVVGGETQRLMTTPLEKSRRIQKQWLKVLRNAFLQRSGLSSRYVVGISTPSTPGRQHPMRGTVAVLRRNGTLWSNSELERRILEAVCPRGSTQAAVESNLLHPSHLMPIINDGGASDDEDTVCSLEERAQEHQAMLAQERLDAMRDASVKGLLSGGGAPESGSDSDTPDAFNRGQASQLNLDVGLPFKRRPSVKRAVPDICVETAVGTTSFDTARGPIPPPPVHPPKVLFPPPQTHSPSRSPIPQMFRAVERSSTTSTPPLPTSAAPIPAADAPPIPLPPRESTPPLESSVPESVAAAAPPPLPQLPPLRMPPPPPPSRPKNTNGSSTSCSTKCCSVM